MLAPRPPRKVRRTAPGRYLRRVSRRSRSTKRVAPWVGYWGASYRRPQSRSTNVRMSIKSPVTSGFLLVRSLAARRPPGFDPPHPAAGYRSRLVPRGARWARFDLDQVPGLTDALMMNPRHGGPDDGHLDGSGDRRGVRG